MNLHVTNLINEIIANEQEIYSILCVPGYRIAFNLDSYNLSVDFWCPGVRSENALTYATITDKFLYKFPLDHNKSNASILVFIKSRVHPSSDAGVRVRAMETHLKVNYEDIALEDPDYFMHVAQGIIIGLRQLVDFLNTHIEDIEKLTIKALDNGHYRTNETKQAMISIIQRREKRLLKNRIEKAIAHHTHGNDEDESENLHKL